jgi:hypothetical protein
MKRIVTFSIIAAIGCVIFIQSCKKEEVDTDTQSAVDNSICEGEFNSRMMTVNGKAVKEQGIKMGHIFVTKSLRNDSTVIPMIIVDTTDANHLILTLDYGVDGVYDSLDGKYRKGKIVTTFYGKWSLPTARACSKLVDYYVSTNGGASYIKYDVDSMLFIRNGNSITNEIIGGKCTTSSWNLEWASSRTFTQIAGSATTEDESDDVFSITGTVTGKDRKGKIYTSTITVPIVKRASCNWIESGRIELTPEGLNARVVDYGNGTCDNKATITFGGNTFSFDLD